MPSTLLAQRHTPIYVPALAIQGGWTVTKPSETDGIEWEMVFGAALEFTFSRRFALGLDVEHFGIENFAGRFGYTRLVLQPLVLSRTPANPRFFGGLRAGYAWKTCRQATVFSDPATARGASVGLIVGSRSYFSPTVAVEGALAGDVMWLGDLVADGLAVYGTESAATGLTFRAGLVISLRGGE